MRRLKKEVKTYIKSIKEKLSCSFNMKAVLIKEFRTRVSDYIEENPDSTMDDIINYFGTPEEIANGFDVNSAYYKKKVKKRCILITILVLLLLAVILFFTYVIIQIIQDSGGHIIVETKKN